ncbi:MAG: DUF1499 domain-containing protein [Pseudomonadales bacterium]|nr:DUF1499 domain-containing protein [Pseudomonadales bacterium]
MTDSSAEENGKASGAAGQENNSGSPRTILLVISILCLLAGLGLGLLALAGPLAVWMGMADFRLGFGFLQIVNSWADWIAGVTLLAAVAIFIIGKQKQLADSNRLGVLALVGAISAGLAWYVPETFRPPEGTPPIHDIATDPYNPLPYVAIAPIRADAANNMDYGVMPGIDSVQQHIEMQLEAYPDIVPQTYNDSVEAVFNRALDAVQAMGWELVDSDSGTGRIEATDTTFWFRFKDDVVIQIGRNSAGETELQARSLSRVGRSDVGKNAERLREFFALMNN